MQNQSIDIFPPLIGVLLDIKSVPDQVFSQKMVGDGIAIDPIENKIYAPITGVIKSIHNMQHAITFTHELGVDILLHIGIDTVNLKGVGFKLYVKQNDQVNFGDCIGEIDIDYVTLHAKSLISPIIILDQDGKNIIKYIDKALSAHKVAIMRYSAQPLVNITPTSKKLLRSSSIIIKLTHGIHARPAATISNFARQYTEDILLEKNNHLANAKSIVELLNLNVNFKDEIFVHAPNEQILNNMVATLTNLIESETEIIKTDNIQNLNNMSYIKDDKYYGVIASKGIAIGTLISKQEVEFEYEDYIEDVEVEEIKFINALAVTKNNIKQQLLSERNIALKEILDAHLGLLSDPYLINETIHLIRQKYSIAHAFITIINNECVVLAKSKNELLIQRQSDLKDILNKVLMQLENVKQKSNIYENDYILVANELHPSDLININPKLKGLVSVYGGITSHVAIIAKSLGIPLIIGIDQSILNIHTNLEVILDAYVGYLNIKPSDDELKKVRDSIAVRLNQLDSFKIASHTKAVTLDNIYIRCLANIGSLAEVSKINEFGAEGIGLFRTEFMFYDHQLSPTIIEQNKIYAAIADSLDNTFPIVIRTFDAGGEKKLNYITLEDEINPVLGMRGIRLSLAHENLLRDQLTAILQVNKSNLQIMLPMVTTIDEIRYVKKIIEDIKTQLKIDTKILIGIMVEVPAIALLIDIIAQEVDFFSIGTNDLTQYILAIDREHVKLANMNDHLNPAVLRCIELVVHGAHKWNKPVAVCGLMASELNAIPILIGLGIQTLSMNINSIPENKVLIRKLEYKKCVELSKQCLQLATALEVRAHVNDFFKAISL